ncbi:MAG: hypothetical protein HY698_15355 [Deltaproteobacteria bacterium]|nr:hypothetical protein [Deltaproteobacteria bacterium]
MITNHGAGRRLPIRYPFPLLLLLASLGGGCQSGAEETATVDEARQGISVPAPVAAWTFDDCTLRRPIIKDSSGNTHDATKSGGMRCAQGVRGRAGSFDGVDDAATVKDAPAFHFRDAVTVSALVRPSRVDRMQTIINKWYAMDAFALAIEGGRYLFSVAFPNGGWGETHSVAAPARAGAWAHVVGVFDGKSIALYFNGTLVASAPALGTLQDSTRPLMMGNHPSWSAYSGLIDDVRIFGVALSAEQVAELARSFFPTTSSDLSVSYIERTPQYPKYDVRYQPSGYNPAPAPGTENDKRWPDLGDTVQFTARVRNQGTRTVPRFRTQWLIDGQVVASGRSSGRLAAGATQDYTFSWNWQDGDHVVRFELLDDSGLPLNDGLVVNDAREQRTNALLLTAYVWENFATWMAARDNSVGTRSAEDWIQFHSDEMNRLFASSVYPSQPEGAKVRIAINRIVRVPSTTPDPGGTHAPEPCPTDGCWGFGGPAPASWTPWIEQVHATRDNGLLHEWGHQLGLIDLYQMDVQVSECLITDGPPRAETFSNSSALSAIDRLFDGVASDPIATYESRPVWFAVRFAEPRAVTRARVKFSDGMTHSWEIWAGPDLDSVNGRQPPATRRGGKVVTSGTDWGDQSFSAEAALVWLLHVDRQDYDRMSHVTEWELYEGDQRIDVAGLIKANRVAGTALMPTIAWDVVHYNSVPGDLMSGAAYFLDEYHVWALNTDANWNGRALPLRRGYYGKYLFGIPTQNVLAVVDGNGTAVAGATIEVFQQQDSVIPNVPKYRGTTDSAGHFTFPHYTTPEHGISFGQGDALFTANPFSTIYSEYPHVVGTNGVLVVRVSVSGGTDTYRFLDLPMFNLEVARGHGDMGVYRIVVP